MRQILALSFLALAACSSSSSAPANPAAGAGGSGTAGTTSAGGAAGDSSVGGAAGTTSTGGAGGTATAGAAGAGGAAALNGCNDADFIDGTADAFDRTIAFGGTVGTKYAPKCLRIKAGQTVTFSGPFSFHPLLPGSTPTMPDTGSPGNPITSTATGMSQAFTFPAAGSYPYLCMVHFATGMTGVVRAE